MIKEEFKSNVEYGMDMMDQSESKPENHILRLRVQRSGDGLLAIGAEGYGELTALDGHGFPVVIEYHNGQFRLMIWAEINQEEPTHVIDLEGARESNRNE